jgi:3-methyladenine DNA glycosylase AlkD
MDSVDNLVRIACETKDKFTLLRELSKEVIHRNNPSDCFNIAEKLFANQEYHPRALATYILGHIAAKYAKSLKFMRNEVSIDKDWRVQEILAQAFDNFCSIVGYKESLPIVSDWLSDNNPNVRRAVTEGLRIWTSRPYFKEHPEIAVHLLSALHADKSTYVRKSVGNALKDISKKHKELVKTDISKWNITKEGVIETYKLASKHLEAREK